jgi:hypothetical protein
MLHGLIMDGHNSLNLATRLLLYLFDYIVYIWTIFTAEFVFTRMVTTRNALLRISLYYQFQPVCSLYDSFLNNRTHLQMFSRYLHLDYIFYC